MGNELGDELGDTKILVLISIVITSMFMLLNPDFTTVLLSCIYFITSFIGDILLPFRFIKYKSLTNPKTYLPTLSISSL